MLQSTVLVVDDDEVVLAVARDTLESAGFRVLTRAQALGTSALILQERPDVVLLDIEMPALSGDSLAELLSERRKEMNVVLIFYSGRDPAELASLVRRTGARGAIRKTGDRVAFLRELERLFQRRRSM